MNYLLDTDTYVYYLNENENIRQKFLELEPTQIFISIPTISELYFGAYNSQRIESNIQKIKKLLKSIEIASSSLKVAEHFGKIKANLKKEGAIISDFDILIASYAMANDLTLVTNNEEHFNRIQNLKVENWLE
ncbi:MAG: PIN domain-containing protein [bacterium]